MSIEKPATPTQEILDSGAVPRLKKYVVRPGKVSDVIFGGHGEYTVERKKYERAIPHVGHQVHFFKKEVDGKEKEFANVCYENPPLNTSDGRPLILMVRTGRISTHDINRGEIPFLQGKEDELVKYLKETQPGIKEKDYIVNGKVVPSPRSMSKEFARGFSEGDRGYTDEQRKAIAIRYIEGIESLFGIDFQPDLRPRDERVISGLEAAVQLAV
jgi:hypothetical protein